MVIRESTLIAACGAVGAVQCLYPWLIATRLRWTAPAAAAPALDENVGALARRLTLWALGGAAALGSVFHAYFLFWALNGWVRWPLLRAVLAANAAQAVSLPLAVAFTARAFPGLRSAAGRRWARRILGGRAEEMARAVAEEVPRGAEVLDLGAGSGLMIELLAKQRGLRPLAFDVHPVTLGSVPVRAYDGVRLPLEDRSVDAGLCVSVLHHCPDPVAVLKELRRVTRGRAVILEDCYDGTADRVGTQLGHVFLQLALGMPWCPCSFGSEPEWRRRLAEAGWRVARFSRVRVRHANGSPLLGGHVSTSYLIVAEPA